jgi:hypothetical protein
VLGTIILPLGYALMGIPTANTWLSAAMLQRRPGSPRRLWTGRIRLSSYR